MPTTVQTALVVDDEVRMRRALRTVLAPDFAHILESGTGREALDIVAGRRLALVVLDLGLPDMAGAEVCRKLRQCCAAPVVALSTRHTDAEKAALLDAGADEYIIKPFEPADFQTRVRAVTRRANPTAWEASRIEFAGMVLDLAAGTLTRSGTRVHLTPTEWALLHVLVIHAGRALTHQQLFTAVWGDRQYGDAQQYLRVHVANLRRKIEDNSLRPRCIHTESGIGYRFDPVDA